MISGVADIGVAVTFVERCRVRKLGSWPKDLTMHVVGPDTDATYNLQQGAVETGG